jgi:hypothetical protein
LSGTFKSDAGWNGYEFPLLSGALQWAPSFFEVRNARAKAFGGDTTFGFLIKPLGDKARPMARFDVDYKDMDLAAFMDHQGWPGLRFAGLASGHHVMEWPLGALRDWQNDGQMIVTAPDGVRTMTPTLAAGRSREWGPFAPPPLARHVPIAAEASYRFDRDHLELDQGHLSTEGTYVTFQGATAWGDSSRFAFHVTSRDWQESDQILAGIISDFGSPTAPVSFGGRGEFDGVMTGPFRRAPSRDILRRRLEGLDTMGDGPGESRTTTAT